MPPAEISAQKVDIPQGVYVIYTIMDNDLQHIEDSFQSILDWLNSLFYACIVLIVIIRIFNYLNT